jgi:hypothetical protein
MEYVSVFSDAVSAIAIVVSLLFVALQLREGNRQTKLNTALEVSAARDRAFDPIYQGANAAIWTKGLQGSPDLTPDEKELFYLLLSRQWHNLQNVVYALENGAIDVSVLEDWILPAYKKTFASPGGASWFAQNKSMLQPSAIAYLDLQSD